MATVIDTSVWIDFTRARSPAKVKQRLAPVFLQDDACLIEPVRYEVLRHATKEEAPALEQHFSTFPLLATPAGIWGDATVLGQVCRQAGFSAASLDLLIAATTLYHRAELVTFDADFARMAGPTGLRVRLLHRT